MKLTECVKVHLSERELLDLSRVGAMEDRSLSEMVRVVLRNFLYGRVRGEFADSNLDRSVDEGRKGTQ